MKTTSLIAISTLLGSSLLSGVSGQLISTEKADAGMDLPFLGKEQSQNNQPAPTFPETPSRKQAPKVKGQEVPKIKDQQVPKVKGHQRKVLAQAPPAPDVVHVTKTRAQIVFPKPNPRLWKTLPEFPGHGRKGKIVAEFKIDDEGHFHKYGGKHRGYKGGWISNEQHKGYSRNEVIYDGGRWSDKGGYHRQGSWTAGDHKGGDKHQGGDKHEGGDKHQDSYKHQDSDKHQGSWSDDHHKDSHQKSSDSQHHHESKGGSESSHHKETKGSDTKKMMNELPKKADAGIVAQSNITLPTGLEAAVSNLQGVVSSSISAFVSAQKSASVSNASVMPKNAAASSSAPSSAPSSSSASPHPTSASSSSSTSGSSNTRQVAVSFVAAMAATAAWCLA